jgi:hypothetical protein
LPQPGIALDHPKAQPLYTWAREKIKKLVSIYFANKAKRTVEGVKKEHPAIIEKINQFQPREQKELNAAMEKIAEVPTIEPEKLATIFEYVIDGYKDQAFTNVLAEIKEMPPEQQIKTLEIFKEFDILEAIRAHKIVSSHLHVIHAFRKMIEAGVPEKPDMHDNIMKHPWLLGIRRQAMAHEMSLEKIIIDKLSGQSSSNDSGKKRPDFFCMKEGSEALVIELKRPGEAVGLPELSQISGYVDILRDSLRRPHPEKLTGTKKAEDIEGYLINYSFQEDPRVEAQMDRLKEDGVYCCLWHELLEGAEENHSEYLNVIKSRAPKEDPRIKELEEKQKGQFII